MPPRLIAFVALALALVGVMVVALWRHGQEPEKTPREEFLTAVYDAEIVPQLGTPAESLILARSICDVLGVGYDRSTEMGVLLDNGFDPARAETMIDLSVEHFCPNV